MTERKRLCTNVEGDFFVNLACIDCDVCRQLAPNVFSSVEGYAAVTRQPVQNEDLRRTFHPLFV